jgi:hypothetical protein
MVSTVPWVAEEADVEFVVTAEPECDTDVFVSGFGPSKDDGSSDDDMLTILMRGPI